MLIQPDKAHNLHTHERKPTIPKYLQHTVITRLIYYEPVSKHNMY